ncbi:hypothetical protein [Bifidobacterium leontopitheci]|uniref:hypothetical protein n=1 Tax=Bifidobacterium leontopitheci TaxID=2650774 RepID=UPI001265277C|nr:hypothetical protein [Bifidobacterium leontopitheci]
MALVAGLAGCGSTGSRKSERRSGASGQETIDYQLSGLGERRAGSMGEFIDSLIKDPATTEKAKGILERAKRDGGMSATDYERSWADYKQCMLDRGYKEIILIKYPNGIYAEPGHYRGTAEQEAKQTEDMRSCMSDLFPLIELYGAQIGNPNLYSNQSEAIVDCMRRNGMVPMSYTVNDYVNDKAKDDYTKAGIDVRDMKVRECEVANNWFSSYPDDVLEHLW